TLTDVLKAAFNLPRPFQVPSLGIEARGEIPTNPGFPSGHTTNAFTVATVIWSRYTAWRVPFVLLALATGVSMIILGLHFPSDAISRSSSVALMRPIGSGKSALVRELVANFLRQGCQLLYYCIDDPADVVRLGLEDHHIAVTKIEEEGRLEFVDMFSLGAQKLAESLPKMDPGDILEETLRFQDLLAYGRSFPMKPTLGPKAIVMYS